MPRLGIDFIAIFMGKLADELWSKVNNAAKLLALVVFSLIGTAAPVWALDPLRCLIEAEDMVELSMPVAGIIAEVLVGRGDTVSPGQVVARLDTRIEQIALRSARQRATNETTINARRVRQAFLADKARRTAALAQRNAVAQSVADEAAQEAEIAAQELAEAVLARELAAIELEQAEALLEQKILRSPVAGIVTQRLLSAGEYQAGETPIVSIAQVDHLRVEAFAPLDYFPELSVGQQVTIRPEPPIGGSYDATVTVIDRVFDAATATFGFRMVLPNPDLALPAGLRCEVVF